MKNIALTIKEDLGDFWIPLIYSERVRSQRTRSYSLEIPEKENSAEILYTLLGYELKVGRRRFACPDLPTARYLQVFARIGCREFAVPYDITAISGIADELETALHRLRLVTASRTAKMQASTITRTGSQLLRRIRSEIAEIGKGEAMPQFKQTTRQRRK